MSLTFSELLWYAGCYHHLCSLDVWSSTIQVEQQAYLLPPLLPTQVFLGCWGVEKNGTEMGKLFWRTQLANKLVSFALVRPRSATYCFNLPLFLHGVFSWVTFFLFCWCANRTDNSLATCFMKNIAAKHATNIGRYRLKLWTQTPCPAEWLCANSGRVFRSITCNTKAPWHVCSPEVWNLKKVPCGNAVATGLATSVRQFILPWDGVTSVLEPTAVQQKRKQSMPELQPIASQSFKLVGAVQFSK